MQNDKKDTLDIKFINMTDLEIETFKQMLGENAITYIPIDTQGVSIGEKIYRANTMLYSSFKDFIYDLNSKAIEEILIHSVEREFNIEIGVSFYKVRFTKNEDLINTKCIRLITSVLDSIYSKTKSKGVTPERLKKHLQSFEITEETSNNMIKLIRIIDKLEF